MSLNYSATSNKKNRGQFYTTNSSYILEGLPRPPKSARCIIEPFAGKGDLIEWMQKSNYDLPIESYDIEPKSPGIIRRDTLLDPPNYEGAWIITNPPYLARNKCNNKEIYDLYGLNDLYKCFITSIIKQHCRGGIMIIPAGFFFSAREVDRRCRAEFMEKYKITTVKYFEERVFADSATTVVAISFEESRAKLESQQVDWIMMPSREKKVFTMSSANNWIVGGEIYFLQIPESVRISRHVEGKKMKEGTQQTFMTLSALDSGTQDKRIRLEYKKDYVYAAKECSRTYATLRVSGKTLSEEEQISLCSAFNEFIEKKRAETWSLFLPQFRESKEYARKRIPFSLAYDILLHIIHLQTHDKITSSARECVNCAN